MDKLLKDIHDYIVYLREKKNLDVCICDVHNKLFQPLSLLSPYNSHNNFFCAYLKKNPHIQKECVLQQLKVRAVCTRKEYFFGTCYAGVDEYVFRIMHENVYLGFISLSSYCKNEQKSHALVERLSEKCGFCERELARIFDKTVKKKIPPIDEIKPLATALARQIELLYMKLNTAVKEPKKENIAFAQIMSFITENYMKNIQIDDIAKATHYSPSYISHTFTSVKKTSVMFYINDLRIRKSKELLEKTDFSITQIAYQVGYNDSNYFASIFKKYTKTTPSKYRKNAASAPT